MTALKKCWDFLGGPVVMTLCSKAKNTSLIPGQEANTPHASGPKNQSNIVTNLIKTSKMVHIEHLILLLIRSIQMNGGGP